MIEEEYIVRIGDIVISNYFEEKGYDEIEGVVTQVVNESMVIEKTKGGGNWCSLPAKFINGKNYMFNLTHITG